MKEKIYRIISQVLKVPVDQINDSASPDSIEDWDSLRHMNLILALEEEFGIQFEEEQITEILGVGLIVKAIEEAVNNP